MAWLSISDGTTVRAGGRVRVNYDSLCFGGLSEEDRRDAIDSYAPFEVTRLNDAPLFLSVEGVMSRDATAAEIRAGVNQAFEELRSRWGVACVWTSVTSVQVPDGSVIPEVPVSTAITAAAMAAIVIVGFVVYRQVVD